MNPQRFPQGVAGGSTGNQEEKWIIDEYGRARFAGSVIAATIATLGGTAITLPATAGQNGQVLTSDGANGTTWATGGSTGVTSVTGTANQVIVSTPTGAIVLSLPQSIDTAAAVQFGSLVATTFATINSTNVSTLTASGAALLQSTLRVLGVSTIGVATITSLNVNGGLTVTGAVNLSTPLTVPFGGTGVVTLGSNGVIYGNGTGVVQVTAQGGANSVLTANAGAPVFSSIPTVTSIAVSGGNFTLNENTALFFPGALSADGKYAGLTESVTAGATLAFGDVVYLNSTSAQWVKTVGSYEPNSGPVRVGMAVSTGSAGNPFTLLTYGKVRADANFPTLVTGLVAYISSVAGKVVTTQPATSGNIIRVLGHANTTHEFFFNPSADWIVHT